MLQLHLDSIAGPNVGLLFCDSTGTCTGAVLVPYRNILAGQHVFLAVGSNNTQAQTTAIVIPTMRVSTSSTGALTGGPGSALHITGAGFTTNETVQVYWGPGTSTFE